jgi:hypothetical protein
MRRRSVANPICYKCGSEVAVSAGGFIGRADLEGKPDMLFVVYCRRCGEHANVLARERGTTGLTPLSKYRDPSESRGLALGMPPVELHEKVHEGEGPIRTVSNLLRSPTRGSSLHSDCDLDVWTRTEH